MTNQSFNQVSDVERLYGRDVIDQDGDKIGTIGQIYLDDQTNQPTFATVKTGMFGSRETFVPLNAADLSGDEVRVPYTKQFVKDAPNVDADGHITEAEEDQIHAYYQGAGTTAGYGTTTGYAADRDDVARTDVRDQKVDTTNDVNRNVDVNRDHEDDGSIVRREEELHVGTEKVQTGRVRLRKHVVTEQKTVTVPVQREEVQVVREPLDGTSSGQHDLGEDEQVITLTEERPVIDKQVVDKERIGLQKETVTDQQQVSADVSREEVTVDRDGGVQGTQTGVRDDRNVFEKAADRVKDEVDELKDRRDH